jgi:hypothetical protein
MTIPDNAKQAILFALKRRGIVPLHVGADMVLYEVQFASGLRLVASITAKHKKTWLCTKQVIVLIVYNADVEDSPNYVEYIDAPTSSHDIRFGVECTSRLLAMVRATADALTAGTCLTNGWLGQPKCG